MTMEFLTGSFFETVRLSLATIQASIDAMEDAINSITVPATLDDLSEGTTNKAFTSTEKTKLAGIESGANYSDLTSIGSRLSAVEAWKSAVKINRLETFSATTNGSGDVTVNTSTSFTNPIVVATPRGSAGSEGYHATVTSVSGTAVGIRVFKNKTQGVLIGGTIDPDEAATSTNVNITVIEPN